MEFVRRAVAWLMDAGRRVALGLLLAALLWAAAGDYRPTPLEQATAPYRFNLAGWEISHLPDKWLRRAAAVLPWNDTPPRVQRLADAEEFFRLNGEIRRLERELPDAPSPAQAAQWQAEISAMIQQRDRLKAGVEETMESELSAVLAAQGLESGWGWLWPPVDTVYARSPGLLILSPRDRIFRLDSQLLQPDLRDRDRERLEALVREELDLSAIVEDTGGVSFYPSVVAEDLSLHGALVVTAHEWLHHWFFFRPLGRNYYGSEAMLTLNETAATVGGEALGDLAYFNMTGIAIDRTPGERRPPPPGAFDFGAEMRETRRQAEALLAAGRIAEAEEYMEQRRKFVNGHGYRLRKLNQAYFAFHGSYATGPASTNPIGEEVRRLYAQSQTPGHFLQTIAQFGSYADFQAALGGN